LATQATGGAPGTLAETTVRAAALRTGPRPAGAPSADRASCRSARSRRSCRRSGKASEKQKKNAAAKIVRSRWHQWHVYPPAQTLL
jgi:hypothetical protein